MNKTAIAKRDPRTALEVVEDWAGLKGEERIRRAAAAVRDHEPKRVREIEEELKPARRALWSAQRNAEKTPAPRGAKTALETAEKRVRELERDLAAAEPLFGLLRSYMLTKSRKRTKTSENTLRAYRVALRQLLEWTAENGLKIHRLDDDDAARFAAYLEAQGLSGSSVNARLAACVTFWKALRWAGLHRAAGADKLEGNPWADVHGAPDRKSGDDVQPYTADEFRALVGQARRDIEAARERFAETGSLAHARQLAAARRMVPTLLLGGLAGLRVSELCALTWESVDLRTGTLTVVAGKGNKTADVPLTEPLVEVLRDYRPRGASGRVLGVEVRRVSDALERLCKRAGVPFKGVHGLRHHAGTEYYRATRDLRGTQEFLRHSSLAMAQRYAHLVASDVREGVKALGEGFARALVA